MFPLFRARVDTGRPGVPSRSGCRGFFGLVPQPLFMKSKVCSEEQTGSQNGTAEGERSSSAGGFGYCPNLPLDSTPCGVPSASKRKCLLTGKIYFNEGCPKA